MKNTALRIGNYVEYAGVISEVTGLDFDRILHTNSVSSPVSAFNEIPLTEEWLLKFVKINWISKDRYGIFYWFNGNKIYIKFVHVLQNTYFCIEQKDLLCRDTVKQNI